MDQAQLFAALTALGLTDQVFLDVGVGTLADDAGKQRQVDEFKLRTSLYLQQIQDTNTALTVTIPGNLGANANRVQPALANPRLLAQYCLVIDEFLIPALNNDLANPPVAYNTYQDYFDNNIFNANNAVYTQNVTNFFGRYPATNRVVGSLTANFGGTTVAPDNFVPGNIETAARRVLTNWGDIQRVFLPPLPGQLDQLTAIKSTGSDFHKGGKQVLILTFSTTAGGELGLIYKPFDVEADCLQIGVSEAVNSVHANFQEASLIELINGWIEQNPPPVPGLLTLPTYRILPYNYGSLFPPDADPLPIAGSYGYIEFIRQVAPTGVDPLNSFAFGRNDFKIPSQQPDAAAVIANFYRRVGELVAVTATFSIKDLHWENLIVSAFDPVLIDLEVALTLPITQIDQTGLFESDGGVTRAVDNVKAGYQFTNAEGVKKVEGVTKSEWKQNRLWGVGPNEVIQINSGALREGFGKMMDLLGAQAGDAGLTTWFRRLNGVVVRYLPRSTSEFANALRVVYGPAMNTQINGYQMVAQADYEDAARKYNNDPTPVPDFLALNPTYTQNDYRIGDVPVYYRRIDSQNIVDSRGNTVVVQNQVTVTIRGTPTTITIGRTDFFANPPTQTNVRQGQVQPLSVPATLNQRKGALSRQILESVNRANARQQAVLRPTTQ